MSNWYSSYQGIALGPDTDGAFKIGKFATSNKDVHFAVDDANCPKGLDVCVDDGGVMLDDAGGEQCMAIRGRTLIRTAISDSPDASVFGVEGILKFGAVTSTDTSNQAGVWAYLETVSGSVVTGILSGLMAMVSLPSGAELAAGGVLCGVSIQSDSIGGTHTSDNLSAIYIPNPAAGAWTYFLQTGDSPGFVESTARTGTTSTRNLTVLIGDTILYIPLIAAT
jgi:hypothetical protein